MSFSAQEVLFSSTAFCNLACGHCLEKKSDQRLSIGLAEKFLLSCKKVGVKKIGFTGGEPFLFPEFLYQLTKKGLKLRFEFDRIMTNAVWFKDQRQLIRVLKRLKKCGYDGSICISVDSFHSQDLDKVAIFIRAVLDIWERRDIISIASVWGSKDKDTFVILKILAKKINAEFIQFPNRVFAVKGDYFFIPVINIDLSAIGQAAQLKDHWGPRWFKEDFCQGPGNVLMVMSDGSVKPCCGYANHNDALTIGNIKKDSAASIIKMLKANSFVSAVFEQGLSGIRNKLELAQVKFRFKTNNHCFFCDFLLKSIPWELLDECLKK